MEFGYRRSGFGFASRGPWYEYGESLLIEDTNAVEPRGPKPRILLLHGVLSTHAIWDRLRHQLQDDATLLAPDLLGWGRARRPNGSYSLDDVIDHLGPVIERFQPTHVLGYSMGGIVALAARSRYPNALEGVGVIGLPVYNSKEEGLEFMRPRGPIVNLFLRNHQISHVGCTLARSTGRIWHPIATRTMPMRPKAALDALFRHCAKAHHGAMTELIFAGNVPGLAQEDGPPVSALHGSDDDSAPVAPAHELAERLAWDFTLLDGETHQLPLARPDLVADWVRAELIPGRAGRARTALRAG